VTPGRGEVTAIIDAPVPTNGMTQQDSGDLTKTVYEIIAGRVSEMGGRISV
jgi:hypothetical protein